MNGFEHLSIRNAAVWLELSSGVEGHGGEGWELGECIWSPSDRQWGGYRILTELARGDLVIHCYQRTLRGYSRVASPFRLVRGQPPIPGRWRNMSPYYRVELEQYTEFPRSMALKLFKERFAKDIEQEIITDRPKRYPFALVRRRLEQATFSTRFGSVVSASEGASNQISTAQGRLVSCVTPKLLHLFNTALGTDLAIESRYSQRCP